MVTSNVIMYADSQYQSDEPIGEQRQIPAGVHNIELSWDRKAGYMRVVIGSQTWWFKELLGKCIVVGTDNQKGRIHIRGMARLDDETLTLYRPPQAPVHPLVKGTERQTTHNRLCYRRSNADWRVRDERRPEAADALTFVRSYVGDLSVEWNGADRVAHVYHNGFVIVDDENKVAHLYDPELMG